jgi:hypothetical protein
MGTDEFGGVAIAGEKRVSVRRHPGQISDYSGFAKPYALNLTVPSKPVRLTDRFLGPASIIQAQVLILTGLNRS